MKERWKPIEERALDPAGRLDVLFVRMAHRGLAALEQRYGVVGLVNEVMPDVEDWACKALTPLLPAPGAPGSVRRRRKLRRLR